MKTYNLPDVVWLDHDLIYNFQFLLMWYSVRAQLAAAFKGAKTRLFWLFYFLFLFLISELKENKKNM